MRAGREVGFDLVPELYDSVSDLDQYLVWKVVFPELYESLLISIDMMIERAYTDDIGLPDRRHT